MPLSGIGLWRRGDHHAEVGAEGVGQVGDAGRRQHAEQEHVDARRGQPGDDRGLEELPGDPGVAADDGDRAVPGEAAGLDRARAQRRPTRSSASSAVSSPLASPRTPSVPKRRRHRGARISAC